MLRSIPSLLVLVACNGDTSPFAEGGDWPVDQCTRDERLLVAANATNQLGEGTRDFDLLDQYAYRVSLTDFCGHTVVLTVGDMGAPESIAAIDDLVSLYEDRPSNHVPLTVLTTWYRTADDEIPEVGDLRRFAEKTAVHLTTRGVDPQGFLVDDGVLTVPVLRDSPRFEDAAAAAAAMWQASDAPEPFIRFKRETEVAGRWGVRDLPFYVVLHPGTRDAGPTPRIVALGTDLVADRILEAAQTNPDLWVPCIDGDTDGDGC